MGMGLVDVGKSDCNGRISAKKAITPMIYSVVCRAGTALFRHSMPRSSSDLHSQHDLRITAGREPLQARREDAHTAMLCPWLDTRRRGQPRPAPTADISVLVHGIYTVSRVEPRSWTPQGSGGKCRKGFRCTMQP